MSQCTSRTLSLRTLPLIRPYTHYGPNVVHMPLVRDFFLSFFLLDCKSGPHLSILVLCQTPDGQVILPPDWQIMALRLDFSATQPYYKLSKHDRCIHEGIGMPDLVKLGGGSFIGLPLKYLLGR